MIEYRSYKFLKQKLLIPDTRYLVLERDRHNVR